MSGYTNSLRILIWLCIFGFYGGVASQRLDTKDVFRSAESLILRYSDNTNQSRVGFTSIDFLRFLESVTSHSGDFIKNKLGACQSLDNCTNKQQCFGASEIFESFASEELLTPDGIIDALPVILNTLVSANCSQGHDGRRLHKIRTHRPATGEAWGYSLAFATSIILISNVGAFLGPIMEKRFFKRILQFLIAMGAGALASTGLLLLIPEAFDIAEYEEFQGYQWKSSVAAISICLLFCSQRALKIFLNRRKKSQTSTVIMEMVPLNDKDELTLPPSVSSQEDEHEHVHSHLPPGSGDGDRRALAWMIMAGDVLHKFADGLSIGAAFTEDFSLGMSLSLAIICEELPHELGDVAILLHSGMSIKRALFVNSMSGCWVYLGVILGNLLGSMIAEASRFIFAMAGALFIYVPLVDMLPDMSGHLDVLISTGSSEARVVAALHACGLLIGVGIMIVIVNISPYVVV